LGDVVELVLNDVNQETRSIVAKPTQVFEDVKAPEVAETPAE
jgi:exoribonuclease-2